MARNDIEEYLILHLQHIFTISILLTFSIVFGNYASVKTATIPIVYRETLLGISIVTLLFLIFSAYYHFKGIRSREVDKETKPNNLRTLFHGNDREDTLKIIQHGVTIMFILAVIVIMGVYLKQGSIPEAVNYALLVFSILILIYTIYVYFICVENSNTRTKDTSYNKASMELDNQLTKQN